MAPIDPIKAELTPIIFRFLKEGPKTKNKPEKVIKKTILMLVLIFSLSIKIDTIRTRIGYVQKIRIARLASICCTESKSPEVKKIDPAVNTNKIQICDLYKFIEGLLINIKGVIRIDAIRYLSIIAKPTPAPKLYAIFVMGPINPNNIPAPIAHNVPTICIYP